MIRRFTMIGPSDKHRFFFKRHPLGAVPMLAIRQEQIRDQVGEQLGQRTKRSAARWLLMWIMTGPLLGCTTTPMSEDDFNSDDPATKLYAITRAGENRDRSAIRHLINQLNSDDPAVRMMAILALERIVGTRRGYNPYDSVEDRQPSIHAWVQAHRNPTHFLAKDRHD